MKPATTSSNLLTAERSHRPRYRLHGATWGAAMTAMSALTLLNFPGRRAVDRTGRLYPPEFVNSEHGWPFVFLVRHPGPEQFLVQRGVITYAPLSLWNWRQGFRRLRWAPLLLDLVSGLAVIAITACVFEWRRRRRRRLLHVTITDLLLATAGVACILGIWVNIKQEQRRSVESLHALDPNYEIALETLLPDWCRELVGDDAALKAGFNRVSLRRPVFLVRDEPTLLERLRSLAQAQCEPQSDRLVREAAGLEYLLAHRASDLCIVIGVGTPDAELNLLKSLPTVQRLRVDSINNRLVGILGDLSGLRELSIVALGGEQGDLHVLARLRRLKHLEIYGVPVGDEDLGRIGCLHNLEVIRIHSPATITDVGLARLGPLRRLKVLSVRNAAITDRGLAVVSQFPDLQSLGLSHTNITGTGFSCVGNLQDLRTLNLNFTQVDDLVPLPVHEFG